MAWGFLTLGLAIRALADGVQRLRDRSWPPPASAQPLVVDCNRASIAELATLPGIGPGRASAIVLHRVRHGPFRSAEDLAAVDGIGPDTLAGLRAHVRFGVVAPAQGR